MAAAHGKGVVHRDLKPDNIFLARRQGDEADETVVKVVDFGIAKFHKRAPQAKGTTPGFVIGTMQYMAPEQMQGAEADPRGDVYALGLILVEMLTARLPWGSSQQDAYADFALRLVKPPLPLQQLRPEQQFSPQLQRLVEELLALEPSQRPAHAGEVLQRLKQVPEAQGADFSGQTHARALAGIAPAEGISAPVRRSTGTEVVAQSRLTGMSGATTPRLRLVMVIGGVAATLLLCGGVYLEWRGPAGSRVHPTPIEPPAAVVKGPSPQPIAPARGPEPAGGPEAAKSVPHRAQHESPALQVQFAFTDIKGVRLTCGGKRLPAPDCSAAGICKSVATVAVGQKCIAEKDGDKKVFTYKGLQKTEADRKNMIHVPVLFP
jgi:serine/threonine-protein kinase